MMIKILADLEEKKQNDEIPDGYKKSEGYLIPKEWELVQFKSLFNRLTRKNKENNQNVLTISAQQGLISQMDYYNTLYASENKLGYSLLYKGDFAYNKSYSGDYAYGAIKQLEAYDKGIVSPLYICFEAKEGTNAEFYNQYFESGIFNREIYKIAKEGARNHGLLNVSTDDFFDSFLVFPSVEEQKKIAKILLQCDKMIKLKEERIEEEQKRKKLLLENLFCTGSKVNRKQGLNEDLEEYCVADIMEVITDYVAAGSFADIAKNVVYKTNSGYAQLIRTVDIKNNFNNGDFVYVDQRAYEYLYRVDMGEDCIVMPNIGANIGEVYYVDTQKLPAERNVLGPNAILLKSKKVNLKYVFYLFNTDKFLFDLFKCVGASGQPKFNKGDLKKIRVKIHNRQDQEMIAQILEACDKKILLLVQDCAEWKKKKKALMQLLLSGIVRVNI